MWLQTNNGNQQFDMFEDVNWPNRPATCNCPNIQTRLQKQNCISWHDNHIFIWHTTLVTNKTTIKTIVEHYGLFFNYFQCKCVCYVESLFLQLIELGTSRSWLHSIDHAPKHMSRNQYCEKPLNMYQDISLLVIFYFCNGCHGNRPFSQNA